MRAIVLSTCLAILASPPAYADDRVEKLLDEIDDLWRGQSSEAVLGMTVKTAHYTRSMKMRAWSKGKEKTLVRILEPLKEKGTATLKSENHVYTYLPKTDRTIRLTSGMMLGSWMGSHFTNDDLVKESRLREDYEAKISFEGERGGAKLIELTLAPRPDAAVVWGKIVMEIGADDHLPRRAIYYDEDQQVARTMTYSEIAVLGGRKAPSLMRMVPEDKKGEYTELRYDSLQFDREIPDSFFSLGNLRKDSR